MNPYTAERRDVLENTPHDISQGRSPSGNLEGRGVQNPRPREISRAEGVLWQQMALLSVKFCLKKKKTF